jgi:hypothetical protein
MKVWLLNLKKETNVMNKPTLYVLTFLFLVLTACNASNRPQPASATASDTLPIETQLVIGTLQLEGTEQAVTGEQAKELLPMWQVYQELNSSSTAAQAEIDGLVEQIQETMTSDQMNAITTMELTQSDIFAFIQEQEISVGGSQRSSSSTQSSGGIAPPDGGGAPPEAVMIGGGAPPDGGIGDMGDTVPVVSTDQGQDAGASSGLGGTASIPTVLIEALIQHLEQMAGF